MVIVVIVVIVVNAKIRTSLTDSLTRSPIELSWTAKNVTPKLKQFPILFVVNFLGFHRDQTRHFGDRGDQGSLSIFALL